MLLIAVELNAQVTGLSYQGKVIDALINEPIAGATVTLLIDDQKKEAVTSASGDFSFSNLEAGYYVMEIRSLGYEFMRVAEIWIHSGVPRTQEFPLVASNVELQSVVVKAPSRDRATQAVNSIHTLTVEETFRYPGTFYDPARLATHFAGVINDNDQANNLVIRGNSPNWLGWYLEDVEIVNPNHLSNAGTIYDRPSQSGGGVNILSAQMIDNTALVKSAFAANYGNALSGVMDMHLRSGATDRLHVTGQIGLNGLDAAVEGPLGPGSFLFNYRYSTLGLLSAMGVDLGDDQINFQDLSFHVMLPLKNQGSWSFFGMAGNSKNEFEGTGDMSLWEEFKDRQNISYKGKMGAVGSSFETNLWKTTLVFSGYSHQRRSSLILSQGQTTSFDRDLSEEGRISLHSRKRVLIGPGGLVDVGVRVNRISYNNLFAKDFLDVGNSTRLDTWLLQAYASGRWSISPTLIVLPGLHFSRFSLNGNTSIEPRIALQQWLGKNNRINLSYGLHSRVPSPSVLFIEDPVGEDNRDLDLIKGHHIVLGYTHRLSTVSKINAELYYQYLSDLPIGAGENNSFSSINSLDYTFIQDLISGGEAENMGIELSYEKYFANNTYYQINSAFFDSKYLGNDNITRNTRYNAGYAVNATIGKEYSWSKNKKIKNLGVNIRAYYRGGFWEGPIDVGRSQLLLTTIYDQAEAFTEQLPDFFKIDFRIHYKRTKEKYTSILGLDILNATNQENIAYYFYNPNNQSILTKNHLGIIPILSYRIEY